MTTAKNQSNILENIENNAISPLTFTQSPSSYSWTRPLPFPSSGLEVVKTCTENFHLLSDNLKPLNWKLLDSVWQLQLIV